MTRFIVSVLASILVLAAEPMSAPERQHVVAHLEMTESWLADEVAGLTPAQLNFRYAPGKWSILDVVEHLTLAEPMYWTGLQKSMKDAPSKPKAQTTDADMLWYGVDRSGRQKTQASEEPAGKLKDAQQGLASFHKLRASLLDYARTTADDLRGHVFTDWGVDGYQGLLGISTHAQRHILQIREIKAQSSFPNKSPAQK